MSTRTRARVIKFCLVGLLATGIHVLVAYLLIESYGVHPAPANGAAFCTATVTSYVLNTFWTFRRQVTRRSLTRFYVVSIAGLCGTIGISAVAAAAGLHYLVGIALVIVLVPPLTYVLHSTWTYMR